MTGDSIRADRNGLEDLATTLRRGATELADTAIPAPAAPDAGRSSANVGAALAAVMKSAAALMAKSQEAAGRIDVNDGAYAGVDNQASTALGDFEGELLEPN
jgi:hypothetical protein